MTQMNRPSALRWILTASSIALSACGGGGGGSAPLPPTPAPAPPPAVAPTITAQPQAQAIDAGTNATFSVGSPNAANYQWQVSTDAGVSWTDVAGATAAMLSVSSPGLIDSGRQYRAVVANAVGNTASTPASLTVRPFLRLLAGALGGHGYLDGQGTAARFDFTRGSAIDAAGNVYVADTSNHIIRRVTPGGAVTTFAGTPGVAGHVDGPTSDSQLSSPRDIAIDSAGTLWFVDQGTCYLRKVVNGAVTSVARLIPGPLSGSCFLESLNSSGFDSAELEISPAGEVFVSERTRNSILRVDSAGTVSLFAGDPASFGGSADGPRLDARFRSPRGLAFDLAGNLYVADSGNGTIRRIDPGGNVTTIAGAAQDRRHLDGVGNAARFSNPVGLVLSGSQTLAITDVGSNTVRLMDLTTMVVTTIAGSPGASGSVDGTGSAARFLTPYGVSTTASGDLVVSDSGNSTLRRVSLSGVVTTLAGQAPPGGLVDGTGAAARFAGPHLIAASAAGELYVSDMESSVIRKITAAGVVTTLAGSAGQEGLLDGAGTNARFNGPMGLAVDAAGNLIVADADNNAIRRVSPTGAVTTIAGGSGNGNADGPAALATFNWPVAVTVDPSGSIFVADYFNCRIRKLSTTGVVTTFAGITQFGDCYAVDGPAGIGGVGSVHVMAAMGVDDILFSESTNGRGARLRRARADGSVLTVAGSGTKSGHVDGLGSTALFSSITALSIDTAGNVHIADSGNNAVRLMRPDYSVTTLIGSKPPANTSLGGSPIIRYPYGMALLPNNAIALSSEAAVLID